MGVGVHGVTHWVTHGGVLIYKVVSLCPPQRVVLKLDETLYEAFGQSNV